MLNKEKSLTQLPKALTELYKLQDNIKDCLYFEERKALRNALKSIESFYYELFDEVHSTNYSTKSKYDKERSPSLRCIGPSCLPSSIEIDVIPGNVFTIGRFDPCVGKKQSNFEFDKRTKAVSRRHAIIERGKYSYSIIDLSSSAGTYVDGIKIPPNTPYALDSGSRVSFGNMGIDYIWENGYYR